MSGRKPDFYLGALQSETDWKNNRVGAAWQEDDGSISIVLDHFVQLVGQPKLYLKLFPNNRPAKENLPARQTRDEFIKSNFDNKEPF